MSDTRHSGNGSVNDAALGMTWWNRLTERERAEWLRRAGSAIPADAWAAFKAYKPDEPERST
jgi:hypothetical protein